MQIWTIWRRCILKSTFIGLETSAWYTRFSNSIIPDYDSNPNQIIYKNLNGYAVTKGVSTNVDLVFNNGLKWF
jgi:outer membrane receptor for ferrienterochelin and colicins